MKLLRKTLGLATLLLALHLMQLGLWAISDRVLAEVARWAILIIAAAILWQLREVCR